MRARAFLTIGVAASLATAVCAPAGCGGSVQLGDTGGGNDAAPQDAAPQGDAQGTAEGGDGASPDAGVDANGECCEDGLTWKGCCDTPSNPLGHQCGSPFGCEEPCVNQRACGDTSDAGTVCTPGDPNGPFCPWGGCLDGPQATCGPDGQWQCPQPPTTCGIGTGSMCLQKGGVCVIGNTSCPSGTTADGIPSPDGECGPSSGPAYQCCLPLPDAGTDASDDGATGVGCSTQGCACPLGGSTCGAGLFCCSGPPPADGGGQGICMPLNNPCA
jgi:hypothetical protein